MMLNDPDLNHLGNGKGEILTFLFLFVSCQSYNAMPCQHYHWYFFINEVIYFLHSIPFFTYLKYMFFFRQNNNTFAQQTENFMVLYLNKYHRETIITIYVQFALVSKAKESVIIITFLEQIRQENKTLQTRCKINIIRVLMSLEGSSNIKPIENEGFIIPV